MRIQRIEFPEENEKSQIDMYLHGEEQMYQINPEGTLVLKPCGTVIFNTYFNAFSVEKWLKYTRIPNLCFEFTGKGDIIVRIWNEFLGERGKNEKNLIAEHIQTQQEKLKNRINIPLDRCQYGIIYIEIENKGNDNGEFISGEFLTTADENNAVELTLDICTYKRETYLYHNLKILKEKLWDNPQSVLYHKFHVIIVDNGCTVSTESLEEWITVYPNKNAGGTAGFTRGMLEALDKGTFTHILLMDDDVEIKPSALEKTYVLLTLLKEEYKDSIIGGAMLRRDFGFIQQESGGRFQDNRIISGHAGVDLRKAENVILNEKDERPDYNAWWYCCIPVSMIQQKGLPLPLFIHYDDVEYGIRFQCEIILMNGICVWHEAFENKRPSVNEYYDIRNALIVNSIYNDNFGKWQIFKILCRRMLTNLFRYRYRDICLNMRALEDFLSGPEWLMNQDAEVLHKQLMESGYHYKEKSKIKIKPKESTNPENIISGKNNSNQIQKKKLVSLNGWLLPACKDKTPVPVMAGESPHVYYRKKCVWIYDPDTELGFYTKKEPKQLFLLAGRLVRIYFHIQTGYKKVQRSYRQHMDTMCSRGFWNKYLELKGERE